MITKINPRHDKEQNSIDSQFSQNGFSTFIDFWKFPENFISFNNKINDSQSNCVLFKWSSPDSQDKLAFYRWRNARFYALLTRSFTIPNSSDDTIYDESGNIANVIRIDRSSRTITLPFNFDSAVWNLRIEEYLKSETGSQLFSIARQAYYSIKPLLPRNFQLTLRRRLMVQMGKRPFPTWPLDMSVEILNIELLKCLLSLQPNLSLPVLSFWPSGEDYAFVITHDVESKIGFDNIKLLSDLEQKYGFHSSWNFVLKQYKIDKNVLQKLVSDGNEIGIHGLYHNGKMFQSKDKFLDQAIQINKYFHEWNCVGFRSPSNIRKLDWIRDHIDAEYDTSSPTTEWYGAQPGGCCTVFPFQYGNIIEIPITMQQDQTLLEILGFSHNKILDHWSQTIKKIKEVNGLILINVHPDYIIDQDRLSIYEELLLKIKEEHNYWHALPRDVANWCRERKKTQIVWQDNRWTIHGLGNPHGKVMEAVVVENDKSNLSIKPMY
jgi:hypothetical protein